MIVCVCDLTDERETERKGEGEAERDREGVSQENE